MEVQFVFFADRDVHVFVEDDAVSFNHVDPVQVDNVETDNYPSPRD